MFEIMFTLVAGFVYFCREGDTSGYIRVWDITTYCIVVGEPTEADIEARKQWHNMFPYISWKKKLCRVRPETYQPIVDKEERNELPVLINTFRGHLKGITCIDLHCYQDCDMLVSSSMDCSIRLWTINGIFIGIFGHSTVWNTLYFNCKKSDSVQEDLHPGAVTHTKGVILPPDIRKVASATTFAVMKAGHFHFWHIAKHIMVWLSGFSTNGPSKVSGKRQVAQSSQEDESREMQLTSPTKMSSQLCLEKKSIDGSKILGKGYKRTKRYHPLPDIVKPRQFHTQVPVVDSFLYLNIFLMKMVTILLL